MHCDYRFLMSLALGIFFAGILVPCLSSFTQNSFSYSHLDGEEEIPQGVSTLAFVFDITGSMYDDLVQVIDGAAKIFNTILARREKTIHNYVLVPFHDPDIGPVTETTDPDVFQMQLKELYVQGGGDCPEMSVGAVKKALEVSLPNSHIYVFTDARAKDYYLLNDVLKLIQRRQSQVVFVMTGDCGNRSHPGYQAYERIASTSSGQVFHLQKSDVNEVLNFVRVSLQSRKVNLFAIDRNIGDIKEFPFDIDGSLKEFTISVSGGKPKLTIINSRGEVVDHTNGLTELLSHRNISVVNIKNPIPGRWKLRVSSEGPHTIRATGLSNIDFVHGFSSEETTNMRETYHRPLKGAPTYLLVNGTELPPPATFQYVKLVDLEGHNLENIPLHRFPNTNLFKASTFYPPNEYFYLKVAGVDDLGFPIERITSTAVSPQLPDLPEVSMRPRVSAYYDEDVDLRCYVQSLVNFSAAWYKEGYKISQEEHFPQTTEILLTVPEVNIMSEGWYSCNATNLAGSSSASLYLDVKEPPPVITKPGNVSGVIGSRTELQCEAHSIYEHNTTWSRFIPGEIVEGIAQTSAVRNSARVSAYPNDSLIIQSLTKEDEGWYLCTATNEGGSVTEYFYLNTYYLPKVQATPSTLNFVIGQHISILCTASGIPEPTVQWKWSNSHKDAFFSGRSQAIGNRLIIASAEPEDEGKYVCIASNNAGTASTDATLHYIEAPLISLPDDELLVRNGDQAVLRCIAEGIPDPLVSWFKENVEIRPLSYIQLSNDGSLVILGAQEVDAGNYTCVASNDAGKVNGTMALSVGSKASIVPLPKDILVDIGGNGSIPCIATGIPKPEVHWLYSNRQPITATTKFKVSPLGQLLIHDVDVSDQGKYICVAENKFGSEEQTVKLRVTGIKEPVISPFPTTTFVHENQDKILNCIILDGNPRPDIQWLQNSKVIESSESIKVHGNGTLQIMQAKENHEAHYMCIATNIGGSTSEETYLNVQVSPSILTDAKEVTAVVGSKVVIPCDVEGDPKPQITWRKAGHPLPTNQEFEVKADGSLTVMSAQEEHSSDYQCIATNVVGTSKETIHLSVLVPPKIFQEKESYTVIEGGSVTLPCKSHAIPPAIIRWHRLEDHYKNESLEKHTLNTGNLHLKAKFTDSGGYSCVAVNSVGRANSTVTLTVVVPPKAFITKADPLNTVEGNDILLSCDVSGYPLPVVRWEKDGELILPSSRFVVDKGRLSILDMKPADRGHYSCIAENEGGLATDDVFADVYNPPKIALKSSKYISAILGEEIIIPCDATGYPTPNVLWKKHDDFGFHQVRNNALHIPFIQEYDGGFYTCTASNTAGSDAVTYEVVVHVPPIFLSDVTATDLEVVKGSGTTLDCSVTAFPLPNVTWRKNDVETILGNSNVIITDEGQKLVLDKVTVEDGGSYACEVSNVAGETSRAFQVNVLVPPYPKFSRPLIIKIKEGEALQLNCSIGGVPQPHIIWRKNRQLFSVQPLAGNQLLHNKTLLKIQHARKQDSGHYTCIALNKVGSSSMEFEVSVLVGPVIQGDPYIHIEEMLQEVAIIPCPVTGVPQPLISWYKDGTMLRLEPSDQVLIEQNGQKLVILETQLSDAGLYTCVASNEVGEDTRDVQFRVLVPPYSEDGAVDGQIPVKEGENLQLICKVSGFPAPVIFWSKDGSSIYPSEGIHLLDNNHRLVIENVAQQDAGHYSCAAHNQVGFYEKDFVVDILTAPVVDRFAESKKSNAETAVKEEVSQNWPVQLSCPMSGNPLPEISWLKNGQVLSNSTHITILNYGKLLRIDYTNVNDTGKYICIAKNEVGEVKKEFELDILVPPSISGVGPESLRAVAESSVALNCSAEGNPVPSIHWLKDGAELILNNQNDMHLSFDNSVLNLTKTKLQNSGHFVCIATNIAGSKEKGFNLEILVPPTFDVGDSVTENNNNISAQVNRPVTFECSVTAFPPPVIQWFKEGAVIDPTNHDNIHIHSAGRKLTILRAKSDDIATYSCLTSNEAGENVMDFNLDVLVPPVIDPNKVKSIYNVNEGDVITVRCPVTGNPFPVITWLKDSNVILPETTQHVTFSNNFQYLSLKNTAVKDAGKYTCIAGNELGTAEHDFKLNVQVPPKLEDPNDDAHGSTTTVLNKPTTLSCPVSGVPPPSVKWYRNGVLVNPYADPNIGISADGKHLKFFHTRVSDAGKYTCRAVNIAGKTEKEFVLGVQVPPSILEGNATDSKPGADGQFKEMVRATESESILLECLAEGSPEPVVLWLKDGHLLASSTTGQFQILYSGQHLRINDVKLSNAGHYTCVASNVAGTTEKDFFLEVQIPPAVKGKAEVSEKVQLYRPVVLDCTVDSNPPPSFTWLKNGSVINFAVEPLMKVLDGGEKLQLLKVDVRDQGRFTCIASNEVGSVSKHFDLDVQVPPAIKNSSSYEDVSQGERVVFRCLTSGNPKPNTVWMWNNDLISDDVSNALGFVYKEDKQILEIPNAKGSYSGKFKCIASNGMGSTEKNFDLFVKMPPKIVDFSNSSVAAIVHQPTELHCRVESRPSADIRWYKNGAIIDNDPFVHTLSDGQTLHIPSIQEEYSGYYFCRVSNSVGQDEKSFYIDVLVPPKIMNADKETSSLSITEGNQSELHCLVSGNPSPNIVWYKNGKVLVSDDVKEIEILENGQILFLHNVTLADSGQYLCSATNSIGSAEKPFNLAVVAPPKIIGNQSTELIAKLNHPLTIPCKAEGTPKPVISWMKNGQFIVPFTEPNFHILSNDSSLHVRFAGVEDAGKYSCIASNAAGKDERHYDVRIHTPPHIDRSNHVPAQMLISNHSMMLDCQAFGIPTPSYSWQKDTLQIQPYSNNLHYQLIEGGKQLKINSAVENDKGKYKCIASNPAGSDVVEYSLDVLIPPKLIATSGVGDELRTTEGQNVVITCPVESSNSFTTLTWSKDGAVINANGMPLHFGFSSDHKQLKIMRAQMSDRGTYTCTASNLAGENSHDTDLVIIVPPKITYPYESEVSTSVNEHQSVTLECVVEGFPHPDIEWLKDNASVSLQPHINFPALGKLRISDVSPEDGGMYSCQANNEGGEDERRYNLSINVPPTINISFDALHQSGIQNGEMSISCFANGIPAPRILWYKDSQMLISGQRLFFMDDGMTLKIMKLAVTDAGKYSCMAMNDAGVSEVEYFLRVHVPPKIERVDIQGGEEIVVNHTVRLHCEAHGLPSPNITWFKNNSPINPTPNLHSFSGGGRYLDIESVRPYDSGIYTCQAKNVVGDAEKSVNLYVSVPPDIPLGNTSVTHQAVIGNPVRITCPAVGTPLPTITWLKNGFPVVENSHLRLLDNDYVLWLSSALEGDSAEYTCIASNNAGSSEHSFNLTVLVPPSFADYEGVEHLSVIVGYPLRIECLALGYPPPDIVWLKEHVALSSGDNMDVSGGVLQLASAEVHHSGTFSCEASNVAGKSTSEFEVMVMVPPTIVGTNSPSFVTSVAGFPATMECHASGVPEPMIMWLKNGYPLHSDYRSNFQIRNKGKELYIHQASRSDSSTYKCVASSIAGNSSKNFVLSVLEPPVIAKHHDLQKATNGSQVLLDCDVEGFPEPRVTWLKDSISISNPSSNASQKALLIENVKLQDAGNYMCIATNEAGSANLSVSLLVLAPPVIGKGESHVKVFSGDSITLRCEATGHPAPSLIWHKDSSLIHSSKEHSVLKDGSLYIPISSPNMSGIYTCIAKNEAGVDEVKRKLDILSAPVIVGTFVEDYSVTQAQQATLECKADGVPAPAIAWERNGYTITDSDPRYKILPKGALHITLVQPSDTGSYTCIAKNEAGDDARSASLVVWVPPSIQKKSDSNLVTVKGRSVEISCHADGFPPPDISWHLDGDSVPQSAQISPDGTLVISNIQAGDGGNYVCLATNIAGRDYHSVAVHVNVPPTITVTPKSQDVSVGESVALSCEAVGIPVPTITWLLNNTEVQGQSASVHGHSVFRIEKAGRLDDGTYACLARNTVGERKAVAAVRVRMPPVVLDSLGVRRAHLQDAVVLDCTVYGDPIPDIIWLKNGQRLQLNHRIQQVQNGSLLIYNSLDQDSGQYKCIARNNYGSAEAVAELVIRSPPNFVVAPRNTTAELGNSINVDCRVVGEPKPTVTWKRDNRTLVENDRTYVFSNNTLRIVAVQLSDEGSYACHANNTLGELVREAEIIVKVDGMWAAWSEWAPCSASCGEGIQQRQRTCENPAPKNGGKDCHGFPTEAKSCSEFPCPVDGEWGNWLSWESCSSSCGVGERRRFRLCNNPSAQYGGSECVGQDFDIASCMLKKCPVNGKWSTWSEWQPCSATCGDGSQVRVRECSDPAPAYGGLFCPGHERDTQQCKIRKCEVHGEWGAWSEWSFCSSSCGGGTRERKRACDEPAPAFGGRDCVGSYTQLNYCNNYPCPVNGEWAPWSPWGDCSSSCNKGQRKRFRTCSNPSPAGGGRECIGPSQEMQHCNAFLCPVDGKWTEWTSWSSCSVTCGFGTKTRTRLCENPEPLYRGRDCVGDSTQTQECGSIACDVLPTYATARLLGSINGFEVGPSRINATISRNGLERVVIATIDRIPEEIVPWLKLLVPLLTPIYWTTAYEIGKALNGYTLTKGNFIRETEVDFGTGEILYMNHIARGLDARGNLIVDIILSGEVPYKFSPKEIVVHPYTEEYLQLGPGSIYAFSTRTYSVDDFVLPYFWNHSISYEGSYRMPYMVQKLFANGISSSYDAKKQQISFIISTAVTKGIPENECPDGFVPDVSGPYCIDMDECKSLTLCGHHCSNYPGAYSCYCSSGFILDIDGHTCNDVNECELNIANCTSSQDCVNTDGSFECVIICDKGFERTEDDLFCQDIDECSSDVDVCSHNCFNTIGSYYCNCSSGYRLVGKSSCVDIDECQFSEPPCSHSCFNVPGSFICACPDGYELVNGHICKDIDECDVGDYVCPRGYICKNNEGDYDCVKPCADGLTYSVNGTCIDIDECEDGSSACHATQICVNIFGSYQCSCARGFFSEGMGRPCQDINECDVKGTCQHICQNTVGSYRCICPTGYRLSASGKSCEDIDECLEQNIACGPEKMCFNMKGSFECIDTPCPPSYERDPLRGYCTLSCENSKIPCPPGVKYADILAFKMVALPSGIRAYQDLVRLVAYDQDGIHLPNTLFTVIENETGVPFRISLENGKGVLYSLKDMEPNREYKIKVKAFSYDTDNQTILYTTKFLVFISISKYPY